ncbi:MAG: peptidoglycan DD-metalloendopeptidase family protein [Clostridia bacterium]|nr:peptidoglycan DD-metalloendopeptidase family protein [Clostridia bacterium]
MKRLFSKKENQSPNFNLISFLKNLYNFIVFIGNKTINAAYTLSYAFGRKNVTKIGYFVILLFLYVFDFIRGVFKRLLPFITRENIVLAARWVGLLLRRHWSIAGTLGLILGFLLTVNNVDIALKVSYKGDVIGYVQNQNDINILVNKVEEDISFKIGETYSITETPKYSVALVKKGGYTEGQKLYDRFFNEAKDDVGITYGLYIDGTLVASTSQNGLIESLLEEVKAPYAKKAHEGQVEFIKDVKIDKAMHPKASLKTEAEIREIVTDVSSSTFYAVEEGETLSTISLKLDISKTKLKNYNPNVDFDELEAGTVLNTSNPEPYLSVKFVRDIVYEEYTDFETVKQSSSDIYEGSTSVKQSGKKGVIAVTAKATYIDGKEVDREVISKEVVSKPRDKIILVGTKPRPSTAPTGKFRWPCGAGYISSPYGYRWGRLHPAIDIAAPYGTAIYAADGGRVVSSGWNRTGYGYLIIIDHGNGYRTWYAHCSKLLVKAGTKVTKGEVIARVGSTGNSTGNHLHFSIQRNGSFVNPSKYVGK